MRSAALWAFDVPALSGLGESVPFACLTLVRLAAFDRTMVAVQCKDGRTANF